MTSIRHWFFTSAIGLALLVPQGVSAGVILWYNGDTEVGLTANEQADSPVGALNTFDDFVVTDASGWTINTVWSNNEMDLTGIAEATWQIRSGVSIGNPGTLVAGGTAAATQSATGQPGAFPGFAEYKIEIAGLNVFLAPGTYWLSVSPVVGYDDVSNGFLHSYNGKTLGTNSVNRPPTDINNGRLDGEFLSSHFSDRGADYSMGVSGHPGVAAVPEPSTLVLAVVAGASVFGRSVCRKRRR